MKFKVGEVVELVDDDGFSCGEYTIDEINGCLVYFTHSKYSSGRGKDFVSNLRKIIKSGQQLEWDW